jgi:deoxyribonuclease V
LVIKKNSFEKIEYITAVDTAYNSDTDFIYAAVVTMKYPELIVTEEAFAKMETAFPYIPGLLVFREGPVILKAFSKLIIQPDMILIAGHGLDHPLSFGLASHLGLLLDSPTIGCSRKRLIGQYDEPDKQAGAFNLLSVANIDCGYVYRSRAKAKPIYISPGHRCGLEDSLEIIKNCLGNYRMPQPLRLAHLLANKSRRADKQEKQNIRKTDIKPNYNEKILSS